MPSTTETAVRRLEAALQSLEHAVEDRLSRAVGADGLAEEVQMLSTDRARLAEQLDQVQARAAKLETLNRDASRRVDKAIDTIRAVLREDGGTA
jgi:predicted  nucleic acid-binding Zn-ribbon protein